MTLRLIANIGAEDSGHVSEPARRAVAGLRGLWARLHGEGELHDALGHPEPWPAPSSFLAEGPAWTWLDGEGARAWLPTPEAAALAVERGWTLTGPAPELIAVVHRRDHALTLQRELETETDELEGLAELIVGERWRRTAREAIAERLAAWPAWARRRAVLKPLWSTSGRRQVLLEDGDVANRYLQRLQAYSPDGAVIEPWLERSSDLSVQLVVHESGSVEVLGTTDQIVRRSGASLGNRGLLDELPRCRNGSHHETLVALAERVGARLSEQGFRGPAGIDALTWKAPDGREKLRPLVELNARYTTGTVALGLLALLTRRSRDEVRHWAFTLQGPEQQWSERARGADVALHLLDDRGAALVTARDERELDRVLP
ncbi:MAG: hypothetical protein AAF533_07085 [Acidobacteriota bacterium]